MAYMYQVPIPLPTPAPVLSVVPSNMQMSMTPAHVQSVVPSIMQSCIASTHFTLIQQYEILRRQCPVIRVLDPQEFDFQSFQLLGSGSSGSVFLAMRNNTSQVAVKVYHAGYSLKLEKKIKNEARILSILQDTGFVPKLHGLLIPHPLIPGKLMLAQEFIGNGTTLWSILYGRDPNIVLNSAIKIYIAYKLVCGLKAIHDKGVLVNDIKSDNVLVDTSTPIFQIRFIDFDKATFQGSLTYPISTAIWLAPEVRSGLPTTRQSDIYSLGYLISQLECPELRGIVFDCMRWIPNYRPSLNEILEFISPLDSNSQRSQQNLMPSVTYQTVPPPYRAACQCIEMTTCQESRCWQCQLSILPFFCIWLHNKVCH
ncbi:serine/threonine-protein kinase MST20-like [Pecten maximus]|uniref:serine/threonine-protein kinase MST20-like n=1 Tax=Pecten maximus TaxID=6579 RepID=UPI001458DBF8|nr:serine/threonine-protein kinase MST20-like [Pecten maximus]XP_033747218.1 serine/threonine-protein kinase MST20-like [Pecten maximus]